MLAVDLDGDGDQDLVTTNANGQPRIFENRVPKLGHWLQLRLYDPVRKRDAIGAVLRIRVGNRWLVRTVLHSSGYLSSADATVHVGLGGATALDDVVVRWPDGAEERFVLAGLDRYAELHKGRGELIVPRRFETTAAPQMSGQ